MEASNRSLSVQSGDLDVAHRERLGSRVIRRWHSTSIHEPLDRKTLWSVRRDVYELSVDVVRTAGEWELRIFTRGQLITWRPFQYRPRAVAYADLLQQDLERDGWE